MKSAEMQPKGYGTSAKAPKGVEASDSTGEQHGKIVNGVAMGKADAVSSGQFNGGRSKGTCYTHTRSDYK
jgi:hypothetical protein